MEGRTLSLSDRDPYSSPSRRPVDKRDFRLLPPSYVPLTKRQREVAVAALVELILAHMRRLEKASARKGEMSPAASSLEDVNRCPAQESRR